MFTLKKRVHSDKSKIGKKQTSFWFVFRSKQNGQILFTSETYTRKGSALGTMRKIVLTLSGCTAGVGNPITAGHSYYDETAKNGTKPLVNF